MNNSHAVPHLYCTYNNTHIAYIEMRARTAIYRFEKYVIEL